MRKKNMSERIAAVIAATSDNTTQKKRSFFTGGSNNMITQSVAIGLPFQLFPEYSAISIQKSHHIRVRDTQTSQYMLNMLCGNHLKCAHARALIGLRRDDEQRRRRVPKKSGASFARRPDR